MEYAVIGAGGTGGSLGGFLAQAGKDVTLIARGRHLEAIQAGGLRLETVARGTFTVRPMKAMAMADCHRRPDVIFVCVKGYSLEETLPFIRRVAHPGTVVIPLLNLYGTGGRMQERLPDLLVADGCIYIAAEIQEPGVILQRAPLFRVVFGVREPGTHRPVLDEVVRDLADSGISGLLSADIRRDALLKFSFISPMAACGVHFDRPAGAIQEPGEIRETFKALTAELARLAGAMGLPLGVDVVAANLELIDGLSPQATTSMYRDWQAGRPSEMDGLLFEVVRLGRRHGVPTPVYERVAAGFGFN